MFKTKIESEKKKGKTPAKRKQVINKPEPEPDEYSQDRIVLKRGAGGQNPSLTNLAPQIGLRERGLGWHEAQTARPEAIRVISLREALTVETRELHCALRLDNSQTY